MSNRGEGDGDGLTGVVLDGRYRVESVVGEGGFGRVYRARHLALDIPVAIKTVRLDIDDDDDVVTQLLDEGRVLKKLRHEHIVAALDLGTFTPEGATKPLFYLVMEWCEGRPLRSLLEERGALPMREAFEIVDAVAAALAHAHASGVVHRDVKPSNIMWTGERRVSLVDFGIAKMADARRASETGATLTAATKRAFTRAYAAPEQATGARTGPWTDVHALGLLFIELLTGTPPYGTSEDVGLAIVAARRPNPETSGVDAGPFAPVIARAVALRPADRFEDAGAFQIALRRAAREAFGSIAPASRPGRAATSTAPAPSSPLRAPAPNTTAPATRTYRTESVGPPAPARSASFPRAFVPASMLGLAVGLSALLLQLDRRPPSAGDPKPPPTGSPIAPAPEVVEGRAPAAASSPAAAPSAPLGPTFCDLSETERKALVRQTGFRGYGFDASVTGLGTMTSLRDREGRWLTVRAQDLGLAFGATDEAARRAGARTLLMRDSDALGVLPDRGISYAIERSCFVSVRGPSAETKMVLDLFMKGFSPDLRGDTFGGGEPIPFSAVPPKSWDGVRAPSLSKLTEAELIERVKATGIKLADAQHVGTALAIDVTEDDARGTVMYVDDPLVEGNAGRYTRGASAEKPTFYATEQNVLVLVLGSNKIASESFVRAILKGIPVHVLRATE